MVSSQKKLANVMGGKTTRGCDSCMRKRARWYCAADDAFLCQFCDSLVHSTNPLARGHERVNLKVTSTNHSSLEIPTPSWHHTKKSRTPRGKNSNKHVSRRTSNPLHLVPEIESDELNTGDLDEQVPYQVPVFDPFLGDDESEDPFQLHGLKGFVLPSDLELAEFATNVESLLGKSFDEEAFDIESLGMADFRLNDLVKVEKEMMGEPFELSFDYDSRVAWKEEDEKVKNEDEKCEIVFDDHVNIHIENYGNIQNTKKTMKMLKLDYEGIIAIWDDDRSPWTTGDRPELDPNDCWPECMVNLLTFYRSISILYEKDECRLMFCMMFIQ